MRVLLFLDISGGELLVIMIFILLFFGSKGIPGIARTMGRTMRQIRDASAEVQREIQRGANEVQQGYQEQRKAFSFDPPSTPPRPAPTIPQPEEPGSEPPGPSGTRPLGPDL